jgi:hypothetical protein
MASAKGIEAGRSFVKLFADDSELIRGLKRSDKALKEFGKGAADIGAKMAAAGAAIGAPLIAATKRFADAGGDLLDMSQRTGISTEALQELGYAAGQTGTDLETVEAASRKLSRTIVEAAGGSKSAQAALEALGVPLELLAGLDPEGQFRAVGQALANVANPAERAALTMEVFGRSGTALLPMLSDGVRGLDQFAAKAHELGAVMSAEDVEAADAFGDALDDLTTAGDGAIKTIGAALAPALQTAAEWLTQAAIAAGEWIRNNEGLVTALGALAAGLVAGGAALVTFGTAAKLVGGTLGIVATGFQLVGAAIGFLLSPIGLATAAVVGLGTVFLTQTEAGKQMSTELAGAFEGLKADAIDAFGGISDALAAGDIGKAAEILWLALKLQWAKGVNWIMGKWNELKAGAINIWQDIGFGIERVIIDTVANLRKFWNGFRDFYIDLWDRLTVPYRKFFAVVTGQMGDLERFDREAADKIAARAEARKKDNAAITAEAERQKQLLAEGQAQVTADRPMIDTEPLAAELARAREEFERAIGEAKEKRTAAEAERAERAATPKKLEELPEDMRLGIEAGEKKVDVAGAFSAAAIRGLGATSMDSRTAKASEETAKNTAEMLKQQKRGGPQFGP